MKKYFSVLMIAFMLITSLMQPIDNYVEASGVDANAIKVSDISIPNTVQTYGNDFVDKSLSKDASFDGGSVDLSSYPGIQKVQLVDVSDPADMKVVRELQNSGGGHYSIGTLSGEKLNVAFSGGAKATTGPGYFEWWRDGNKVVWIYDLDSTWHYRNTTPDIHTTNPPSSCYQGYGADKNEYYSGIWLSGTCAQGTFKRTGTLQSVPPLYINGTSTSINIADVANLNFDADKLSLDPNPDWSITSHLGLESSTLNPQTLEYSMYIKMDFAVPADIIDVDNSWINRWWNNWSIGLKGEIYSYPKMAVYVSTGPTGNEPDLGGIVVTPPMCLQVNTVGTFNVHFSNNGVQSVNTGFRATIVTGSTTLANESYSSLASGSSKTITVNYTPTSAGSLTLTITLDPDGAVSQEVLRGDNTRTVTYTVNPIGTCSGGGGMTDGDFDIVSPTINYRDTFDVVPRDFIIASGCTYLKHEFQFKRGSYTDVSHDVNGQTVTLQMTYDKYKYMPAIAVGTVQVSLNIHTTCGTTGWIKTKPLTVINNGNLPPTINIAWFARGDRTTPVTTVQEGQPVDLVLVNTSDPDGDIVTWDFNFSSSGSAWIRGLPSAYGFGSKETDYNNIQTMGHSGSHTVSATAEDGHGGQGTASASLFIQAPAPIPVITGPNQVVQGRPLPSSFSSAGSYSPIGRTINHSLDEWGNLRATYPTPGNEIITLWVTDSAGKRSEYMAAHTLKVIPDKPPIAQLDVPPIGIRNQTFDIYNRSYSEDGDTIVSAEYKFKYDANNNGFGDDGWQPLTGDLTKTSLRPSKVGKYLFYIRVCEDYGACGDTSAVVEVGLTLNVTNLAPEVRFDISGKNEQPEINPSIPFSASAVIRWGLYETNTNNVQANKPYMWADSGGVLSAGLGKGMEKQYTFLKVEDGWPGPNPQHPVFAHFTDNGFGPNAISPYRGMLSRDTSKSQPLLLPPVANGNFVVKTPVDPTTPLTPVKFNTDQNIQSTKTHFYFWTQNSTHLMAYNKNRIPTYQSGTKFVGDASSFTSTLVHYWSNGVNPYDLAFPRGGGQALDSRIPSRMVQYHGGPDAGWRSMQATVSKHSTMLLGDKIVVVYSYALPNSCSFWEEDTEDGYNSGYNCAYDPEKTQIAKFDAVTGGLLDDGLTRPIPANVLTSRYGSAEYIVRGNNLLITQSNQYDPSTLHYLEADVDGNVVRNGTFSQPSFPLSYSYKFANPFNPSQPNTAPMATYDCRWSGSLNGKSGGSYTDDEGNILSYRQISCWAAGASSGSIWDPALNPDQPTGLYLVKFDINTGSTIVSPKLKGRSASYSSLGVGDWPQENDPTLAYNPATKQAYTRSFTVTYCNGCMVGTLATYYEVVTLDGSGLKWDGPAIANWDDYFPSPFYITPSGTTGYGTCSYTASGTCEQYTSHLNEKLIDYVTGTSFGGGSFENHKADSMVHGQFVGDGLYLSIYAGFSNSGAGGHSQGFTTQDRWIFLDTGPVNTSTAYQGFKLGQFMSPGQYDNSEINFTLYLGQAQVDSELAGFSFRAQDPANRYAVEVDGRNLYLSKYVAGGRTVLQSSSFPMADRVDYAFRVTASGNNLKVTVNGVPYFDLTDGSFAAGKVGPFSDKSYATFKSMSLKGVVPDSVEWKTEYAIYNEAYHNADIRYDNVQFTDPENDPMSGTFKWSIAHTPKFFNNQGYSGLNGGTFSSPQVVFDAVGVYDVTLQAKDDPHPDYLTPSNVFDAYRKDSNAFAKRITVHRRAVAFFTISQGADGRMIWDYQDYDPDRWVNAWTYSGPETPGMNYGVDRGIKDRKFYFITPSGVRHDFKLSSPQEIGNYIIGMQSIDEWGAESIPYEVSYWVNVPGPANTPPVASMRIPDGTYASPNIITITRPYFEWNQTDIDPGTLFSAFQIQVTNEWGGAVFDSYSLGQGPTGATIQGWTVTSDMPVGQPLQVRVRVYDGTDWSDWSLTTWFYINRPPTTAMTVPNGTQGNPTIFTELRPTFQWTQTDLDPYNVFTYFQLQVINEANTVVVMDTGHYWQGTTSLYGSYAPTVDLPKEEKLRVWVQAFDGYVWSGFSPQTWFLIHINNPPVADFNWSPNPAYEGDTITITNLSSDPDGDMLTSSWTITGPNGYSRTATSTHTSIAGSDTANHPGNYVVQLTVTDPDGLSSTITKTIPVLDLSVTGFVEHTDRYEELRKAYNLNASGDPEYPRTVDIFAAGEAFMLRANTTDTGASGTKAASVHVTRHPFPFDTALSSRTKLNWSGKMVDDDYNEKLTDGNYRFTFDATWSNGHTESVDVIVKVEGDNTIYFNPARKETN